MDEKRAPQVSPGEETEGAELDDLREQLAASNAQLVSTTMALVRRQAEWDLLRPRLLLRFARGYDALLKGVRNIRKRVWKLDHRMRLVAVSELGVEGHGQYRSLGNDPYFLAFPAPGRPMPSGYARICFAGRADAGALIPQLFMRSGQGEGSWSALSLGVSTGKPTTVYARLPDDIQEMRLDPCEEPGAFQLTLFEIKSGSTAWILRETLRRQNGTDQPLLWQTLRALFDREQRQALVARIGMREDSRDYQQWLEVYEHAPQPEARRAAAELAQQAGAPLISVLMPVFNPPPSLLTEAIESVRRQIYPKWELCIADDASTDPRVGELLRRAMASDARIRVEFRPENGHISRSSNTALAMARGSHLALLDHDDLLTEHALYEVAKVLLEKPATKLLYSDEDKIGEDGLRSEAYFKCDWNYDLFLSQNLVCHLAVYEAALVRELGGFRVGFEGAQDYDLALRCIERLEPLQIVHIPKVLYHWRIIPGSTAMGTGEKPYAVSAGERALGEHLQRSGVPAEVVAIGSHYRVRYALPEPAPLASLIIPTRNAEALVRQCIDSIRSKTTYPNYEILLIDNGSDDPAALAYFATLAREGVRLLRDDRPFNYSALNNAAVRHARGEVLVLVNNDIEVITPEWLGEMVSLALRPGIGAVGARLWYPDGQLQHGGVVMGVGGIAGHAHHRLPRGQHGYFSRAELLQSFSAVTAACLAVRRDRYKEVGGLNETDLVVAFNDVDFCLKLVKAGYRNLWTPYAELYHHESATRGDDLSGEKLARFQREIAYMAATWPELIEHDPAYNPNLSLTAGTFQLSWPPRAMAQSQAPKEREVLN